MSGMFPDCRRARIIPVCTRLDAETQRDLYLGMMLFSRQSLKIYRCNGEGNPKNIQNREISLRTYIKKEKKVRSQLAPRISVTDGANARVVKRIQIAKVLAPIRITAAASVRLIRNSITG